MKYGQFHIPPVTAIYIDLRPRIGTRPETIPDPISVITSVGIAPVKKEAGKVAKRGAYKKRGLFHVPLVFIDLRPRVGTWT